MFKLSINLNSFLNVGKLYLIRIKQSSAERIISGQIFENTTILIHKSKTPVGLELYSTKDERNLTTLFDEYQTEDRIAANLDWRLETSITCDFTKNRLHFVKDGQVYGSVLIKAITDKFALRYPQLEFKSFPGVGLIGFQTVIENDLIGQVINLFHHVVQDYHLQLNQKLDLSVHSNSTTETLNANDHWNRDTLAATYLNSPDYLEERKFYIERLLLNETKKESWIMNHSVQIPFKISTIRNDNYYESTLKLNAPRKRQTYEIASLSEIDTMYRSAGIKHLSHHIKSVKERIKVYHLCFSKLASSFLTAQTCVERTNELLKHIKSLLSTLEPIMIQLKSNDKLKSSQMFQIVYEEVEFLNKVNFLNREYTITKFHSYIAFVLDKLDICIKQFEFEDELFDLTFVFWTSLVVWMFVSYLRDIDDNVVKILRKLQVDGFLALCFKDSRCDVDLPFQLLDNVRLSVHSLTKSSRWQINSNGNGIYRISVPLPDSDYRKLAEVEIKPVLCVFETNNISVDRSTESNCLAFTNLKGYIKVNSKTDPVMKISNICQLASQYFISQQIQPFPKSCIQLYHHEHTESERVAMETLFGIP